MKLKGYTVESIHGNGDDTVKTSKFNGATVENTDLTEIEHALVVRTDTIMLPVAEKNAVDGGTVVAFLEELRNLGYWVNDEAYEAALKTDAGTLAAIIDAAKKAKGADVNYEPMYPNFPKQVAEASDLELWQNAIFHYIGRVFGQRVMPVYDFEKRAPLTETTMLTVLGLAADKTITTFVNGIVNQGQPYSMDDRANIVLFSKWIRFDEVSLDVKENLVWFASTFKDKDLSDVFKTTTDVLRYAVALSDGDFTLATNSKFKLSRPQRRQIMGLLENVVGRYKSVDTLYADMATRQENWKRLAYALHPNETSNWPKATLVLDYVQANRLRSFDSQVDAAIKSRDLDEAIRVLSIRPGVYARRVIELLRKFSAKADENKIVDGFSKIADKVSSPVLIQLYNLLNGPLADALDYKTVIIKSATSQKSAVIENKLKSNYPLLIDAITEALAGRNSDKFIEIGDRADSYTVPLNVRNASEGTKQIGRGSRVTPKDDKNIVRLFMHWHNIVNGPETGHDDYTGCGGYYSGNVDLDLSAVFLNDDFNKVENVWYGNLRGVGNTCLHSGDITSAPNGAAEFIEIDRREAVSKGYRYVAPCVYSYSRQPFSRIPEAYAGVMLRDAEQDGSIFEPSTVEVKYDLNGEGVNSIPFLYDLVENEIIWWDMAASNSQLGQLNNVVDHQNNILIALKTLVLSNNMTVGKLAKLTANIVVRKDTNEETREKTGVDHEWYVVNPLTGAETLAAGLTDDKVIHIEGWESERILNLL